MKKFLLFLGILICLPMGLQAQVESQPAKFAYQPPKRKIVKPDTLSIKQRLAIRTNIVDWAAVMPNLGVEFDLSGSPYNKLSILASGRFNFANAASNFGRFNVEDGRLELRSYWHNRYRNGSSKYKTWLNWAFSHERHNARTWRTYYVGAFVQAGHYNVRILPSVEGFHGNIYQVGISYGLQRSLYQYGGNSLDIEIGGSLAAGYASGERFKVNSKRTQLVHTRDQKGFTMPLPGISVSLVYRFGPPAKERYRYNQSYHNWLDAQQKIRRDYLDSLDRAIWQVEDTIFKKRYDRIEEIIDLHDQRVETKASKNMSQSKKKAVSKSKKAARKDSVQVQSADSSLSKVSLKIQKHKQNFKKRREKAEKKWKATSPQAKLEAQNDKLKKKEAKKASKKEKKTALKEEEKQ